MVNIVIKNTPWGYKFAEDVSYKVMRDDPRSGRDIEQFKDENILGFDMGPCGVSWIEIGRYTERSSTYSHRVSYADVWFQNDKLVEFKLHSPEWSADRIDAQLKPWARFAMNKLTAEYGKPTKYYQGIEALNILDFKSGFSKPFCEWRSGNDIIQLRYVHADFKFGVIIKYIDGDVNS